MKLVLPIKDRNKVKILTERMRTVSNREHLWFLFGIYTGLRIVDILKLRTKDVKNKEYLHLVEQKTSKEKVIFINPILKKEIKKYCENKGSEQYLFESRERGKPITRQRVWQILKRESKNLGLDNVGCHTLRKTFGYFQYKMDGELAYLQDLFDHSSQKITLRYIGVSQEERDKKMRRLDFR